MDETIRFVGEYGVIKDKIKEDLEKCEIILQNIDTDPNEVLSFYGLTDEYFLAMEKTKKTKNEAIIELKDKIQEELESFDSQA